MLIKTLAAGAALSMLVAGGAAVAQTKSSATIGPSQPIPYSQWKAYDKASPKTRATKDWSASASTGTAADTSATMPSTTTSAPAPGDSAVNPPAQGSSPLNGPMMPATPPTNSMPSMGDPTMPGAAPPGSPGTAPITPPPR